MEDKGCGEGGCGGAGGERPLRSCTKGTTSTGGGGINGKSCKGCLFYSSIRKSGDRKPVCVGVTRALENVPGYIVGESEMEASREGRDLSDFKYACVGYSVFAENKDGGTGKQEKTAELPFCVGIEILLDKKASHAGHAHSREDALGQPGGTKSSNSDRQEFRDRFLRNAGLVASGVVKNLNKIGNYVKSNFDDILYPYRRRPK